MSPRRLLFVLSLLTGAAAIGAAPVPDAVATERARTRFVFEPALLESFGLEVVAPGDRFEFEAVVPSGFVVDAVGSDFEGITGGALRHVDGFTLRFGEHAVSMVGFEIRPGDEPLSLALYDSAGRRRFTGDQMHSYYDPVRRRLRIDSIDLRISPELAAELGRPDFAGIAIARVEIEATTTAVGPGLPEGGVDCSPPVWSGDVDIELVEMASVQQRERNAGRVVLSPSARLRNVGTADIPWYRKFEGSFPPYNNDQHPYLIYALYRIAPISGGAGAPTAIRMLAQSGLKHAVYATNQDCHCAGGHILYAPTGVGGHDTVPCADVYGTASNDDSTAAGPREDGFEAHLGTWTSTGSFFDQDGDGECDWNTGGTPDCDYDAGWFDNYDRRLDVAESELSTPGATYYVDSWYIVRRDVDIFNSMGWRQVLPTFSSPNWSFPYPASTALANGSVLDAWVPRAAPPAGASHERVDTGVGELSLAVRTTALGGGVFHYEYALANHDFDRKVQRVSIPFPPSATISNAVFRDLDDQAANDWTVTVGATSITFQAPAAVSATALDYGTLFSFGFDADVAPASASIDLKALEETPTLLFAAPAVTPGGARGQAIFFDDFESGGTARWSARSL